jgi:hypothetical protein
MINCFVLMQCQTCEARKVEKTVLSVAKERNKESGEIEL